MRSRSRAPASTLSPRCTPISASTPRPIAPTRSPPTCTCASLTRWMRAIMLQAYDTNFAPAQRSAPRRAVGGFWHVEPVTFGAVFSTRGESRMGRRLVAATAYALAGVALAQTPAESPQNPAAAAQPAPAPAQLQGD